MGSVEKRIIIICGPTAVGKTKVALEVAQHFNTQIISADSKQCYKELNIGVAKPSPAELELVHHYFINSHSIHEDVNAAAFEKYALNAVNAIFESHDTAVMVGGTGLYIKAFTDGLDEIPAVPSDIRERISAKYKILGLAWLQREVKESDHNYWLSAEQSNPQRLMRALEVKYATGKSVTDYRKGTKIQRPFAIHKFGIELAKEQLYNKIHERVDNMMNAGLLEEAKCLIPHHNLNALQTVGYRELFDYLHGICTLKEAVDNIKKNTRYYAKRQMTWFKKDPSVVWYTAAPQLGSAIINSINSNLLT